MVLCTIKTHRNTDAIALMEACKDGQKEFMPQSTLSDHANHWLILGKFSSLNHAKTLCRMAVSETHIVSYCKLDTMAQKVIDCKDDVTNCEVFSY